MTLLLNDDRNSSRLNKFRIFYHRKLKDFWLTYQWVIIAFFWVLTFVTGYIGYQRYLPLINNTEGSPTPSNIIYHIIQLFVLQASFPANVDWNLQIARFLAPTLLALAGLQALLYVFNSRIDNVFLRFTNNHIIICGLGERGLAIAQSFFDYGEKITVIDNDLDNINIKFLKQHGVRIISGDATSIDLLNRIRAPYCRYLFATMNDDGENVEIAVNLFKLLRKVRRKDMTKFQSLSKLNKEEHLVQCFINIADPQIRNLLKHHSIATDPNDLFELKFFNTYENSSNLVFRHPELNKYIELTYNNQTPLHIAIVGFGEMGQEIYLMILRLFEFLGPKKLHFIVFDISAEKKMQLFLKRYPNLDLLSTYETKDIDINEADFLDEISKSIQEIDENEEMLIFFCIDTDNIGVSAALSILPILRNESIPIFVQTYSDAGLATILRSKDVFHFTNNPVIPFGIIKEICNKRILINPTIDTIALKFHDHYIEHQKSSNTESDSNPFLTEWDLLPEERKDSYRNKVRTLEIFMNSFGFKISTKSAIKNKTIQFTNVECQKLAEIEHSRWLADRILAGWRYQEGNRINNLKKNPLLVEWSKLSERSKNSNIKQIQDIPEILSSCNLIIERKI